MEMTSNSSAQPDATIATKATIKSLDAAAHAVTLDNGKVCDCAKEVDLAKFKSGDKVDMTFSDNDGKSECCAMTRTA